MNSDCFEQDIYIKGVNNDIDDDVMIIDDDDMILNEKDKKDIV